MTREILRKNKEVNRLYEQYSYSRGMGLKASYALELARMAIKAEDCNDRDWFIKGFVYVLEHIDTSKGMWYDYVET